MDQISSQLRHLETRLATLRQIRDSCENSRWRVKRMKHEYQREREIARVQLQVRLDQGLGTVPDPALAHGNRQEQKAELERRLWAIKAQRLALQNSAVASTNQVGYELASRLLEEKLRSQICILDRREFRNRQGAFDSLKRYEIAQANQYHQRMQDLHDRLVHQENLWWTIVRYWDGRLRETIREIGLLQAEIQRIPIRSA